MGVVRWISVQNSKMLRRSWVVGMGVVSCLGFMMRPRARWSGSIMSKQHRRASGPIVSKVE
eukprot:5843851-Heterocapsa_arctica.AAC.1